MHTWVHTWAYRNTTFLCFVAEAKVVDKDSLLGKTIQALP